MGSKRDETPAQRKRRQAKAALTEHRSLSDDDLLIPHEFEETIEHLRGRKAIIVLTLDRPTGIIDIDDAMASPAEVAYMLRYNQHALLDANDADAD